jgi:hypothetical protein
MARMVRHLFCDRLSAHDDRHKLLASSIEAVLQPFSFTFVLGERGAKTFPGGLLATSFLEPSLSNVCPLRRRDILCDLRGQICAQTGRCPGRKEPGSSRVDLQLVVLATD